MQQAEFYIQIYMSHLILAKWLLSQTQQCLAQQHFYCDLCKSQVQEHFFFFFSDSIFLFFFLISTQEGLREKKRKGNYANEILFPF